MKTRLLAIVLVLALMFTLGITASAQEAPDCFNLSEADCTALNAAVDNTLSASSFYQKFSIDFTLSGLSNMVPNTGDITFNATGEGPFATNGEGILPIIMQVDLSASADDGTSAIEGTAGVRIVDGVLYFQSSEADMQWIGIDLMELMMNPDVMEGLTEGLPVSPDSLMGGEIEGLPDVDFEGVAAALPAYANYEVLPAEDMMGQSMTPYKFTFDVTGLLQDDSVKSAIQSALQEAAAEDPTIGMMAPLLEGITGEVIVTRWVGTSDNFVHRLEFVTDIAIDLNALLPSSAEDAPELDPIAINLTFNVELDQFNETFEVVAPEGATMLDPETMMPSDMDQ